MTFPSGTWSRVREAWDARREPERMRVLAHAYWHAVLLFLALVFVSTIACGAFLLRSVLTPEADRGAAVSEGSTVPALDQEKLNAVLDIFYARAERYGSLEKASAQVVDPSRPK